MMISQRWRVGPNAFESVFANQFGSTHVGDAEQRDFDVIELVTA